MVLIWDGTSVFAAYFDGRQDVWIMIDLQGKSQYYAIEQLTLGALLFSGGGGRSCSLRLTAYSSWRKKHRGWMGTYSLLYHRSPSMEKPGYYLDNHYTAYFPELLRMVKEGRVLELELLLLPLIEAMEAECQAEQLPRPRMLHDVLLTVLRLRRAPYREQMELLEGYLRYPLLFDTDRDWAKSELERVRGQLVA